MQWGFIPSWTNKNSNNDKKTIKAINARDDSLLGTKQLFRRVKQNQRCVVVATGYYEWRKEDNKKIPYYVSYKDGKLLLLAAVYDVLKQSDGSELYTYAIVTTKCSKSLAFLHPRMPVIFNNDEDIMNWINPRNSFNKVSDLMKSTELNDNLQCYRVSTEVNKIGNQSPDLIVEVKEEKVEKKTGNKSITDFFSKKVKTDVKKEEEEEVTVKQEIKDEIKEEEEEEDGDDDDEDIEGGEEEEEKPKLKPQPQSKPNPKSKAKPNPKSKAKAKPKPKPKSKQANIPKPAAGQKRKMANKNNNAKKIKN